ncbi:MAG: phage tail protein [Candidatus Accumulibacter sp.]|jgi:hypothetical protein|nr:phage tail protein [Accumulibacter sp.]
MLKPASLRAALTAANPYLQANPDALHVRVESGQINSTMHGGLSFEYQYDLVALVTDYADHPDMLFLPILAWLNNAQPDMLQNPARRADFTFEVDALDNEKCDIEIKLSKITERVAVTQALAPEIPGADDLTGPGTIATIRHLPEPKVDPMRQIEHWEFWIGGEKIREWDVPPFDGPVTPPASSAS